MLTTFELPIRVRYYETDAQGHVHHAVYLHYFEVGRIEMLRAMGIEYDEMERQGYILVITEASCRYYRPCRFDDLLLLKLQVEEAKGTRIWHSYQLFRDDLLITEGKTTACCITREGKPQRLPEWLLTGE